jgi:hypothetical protein
MSVITKLKLVTSTKELNASPIVVRRNKLVDKINEQIELAVAKNEGRLYAPNRIKNVTNADGKRVAIETTKRVKEWFWVTPTNKINLSLRYGSKILLLNAKGANAIEVATANELIDTLSDLRDAVSAGELDEAITKASEKLREGFAK